MDGLVAVLELDEAVPYLVVEQPHLARRERVASILQALRERLEGACIVLRGIGRAGLLE